VVIIAAWHCRPRLAMNGPHTAQITQYYANTTRTPRKTARVQ